MNNQIQVVLKSSTTEMSLNDHDSGIYIVPELNGLTGLPDIRTTSGVNAGYDGGWTSAQNYDARSITLRGVIANEDKATVERMRKQLVSLLGQGKNEELTLDIVTEAGSAYEIQVRTIACEMAMQRVLTQQEFMIQLRADDPLIYDNTEAGEPAIVQVQKALGGFQIPFEIPLAIGGGEDASVIDNHGLEQVAPIVKMYGALHNPKIINQTTNQYMQIEANLGYAEGAYTDAETSDSGQHISFDAPITAPLADFSLKGNTTQQTYSGKNLYNVADMNTVSPGVTIDSEGWITIQHTATGSEVYLDFRSNPLAVQASTNYAIVTEVKNISGAGELNITSVPSNPQQFNSRVSYSFSALAAGAVKVDISTTKSNVTSSYGLRSYCYFSGTQSGSVTFRISVMPNTSVTPQTFTYEPYVGGIPAPNPDYPQAVQTVTGENVVKISDGQGNEQSYEINLGKNIIDVDFTSGTGNGVTKTLNADGSITLNGHTTAGHSFTFSNDFIVEAGQTYTLSVEILSGSFVPYNSNQNWAVQVNLTDPNASTPTVSANPLTTSGINVQYTSQTRRTLRGTFWFGYNSSTTSEMAIFNNFTFRVQIEKGSQATSYAAYFTPIELCKIGDYQDYIYKDGSDWKIKKQVGKFVLDSAKVQSAYNKRYRYAKSDLNNAYLPANGTNYLCGYFTAVADDSYGVGSAYVGGTMVNFRYDENGDNIAGFKNFIDEVGLSLYCQLNSFPDITITNEALVAQLDAILNSGRVYEGTNNITTVIAAGNSQGEVQVSYYTHQDPATRDEIIIDSRLRTITLNGLDIYDKKTEGSEFLMLAPGENKLILQSDIDGDNGYAEVNYKQGYLSI